MNIYVASSWRNEHQQMVVEALRKAGHEVYDFKNPPDGKPGFHWSDIDPNWKNWTIQQYKKSLTHEHAQFGFNRDFSAMKKADACVLVLPCGRSAHLEAGWLRGAGKKVIAFIPGGEFEPELMYNLLSFVTSDIKEVLDYLESVTIVEVTSYYVDSNGNGGNWYNDLDEAIEGLRHFLDIEGDPNYKDTTDWFAVRKELESGEDDHTVKGPAPWGCVWSISKDIRKMRADEAKKRGLI